RAGGWGGGGGGCAEAGAWLGHRRRCWLAFCLHSQPGRGGSGGVTVVCRGHTDPSGRHVRTGRCFRRAASVDAAPATGISAVRQRRNPGAAGLCRGYRRSGHQTAELPVESVENPKATSAALYAILVEGKKPRVV